MMPSSSLLSPSATAGASIANVARLLLPFPEAKDEPNGPETAVCSRADPSAAVWALGSTLARSALPA